MDDALRTTVLDLQHIYTIVLALAIGEAFKQFVADAHREPQKRRIHWNQLLALVAFLVLVIPFFQGMSRHFYVTYFQEPFPSPYSVWLFVDCIAFTIEGSLFFVLSRSLPAVQWKRFYTTVILLLALDGTWGLIVHGHNAETIQAWLILDGVFLVVFGLVLLTCWKRNEFVGATIGMLIAIIRTVLDYTWLWQFYFPE
jgi:hypothetical protein